MCVVLKCSNVDQGNVNDDSDDEDNDSIRDAEDFLKRHRPPKPEGVSTHYATRVFLCSVTSIDGVYCCRFRGDDDEGDYTDLEREVEMVSF